jgi:hypothetical protein
MGKLFAIVLAILFSFQVSAAGRPWTQQDILREMSSEFAYCASYYGISQTCAERSGAKELAKQLDGPIDKASDASLQFGMKSGMTQEAVDAFILLTVRSFRDLIHDDCANLFIAILKYADSCKALMENPTGRISVLRKGPPADAPK